MQCFVRPYCCDDLINQNAIKARNYYVENNCVNKRQKREKKKRKRQQQIEIVQIKRAETFQTKNSR